MLNETQLRLLEKKAEENDFYKSLLEQYNDFGSLSEKQMEFVKNLEEKYNREINKNKKLTDLMG